MRRTEDSTESVPIADLISSDLISIDLISSELNGSECSVSDPVSRGCVRQIGTK